MTDRLVTLRPAGSGRAPLFAIPGAGGRAEELAALAAALPTERPVLACEPWRPDAAGRLPPTVEAMADQAVAAIRARQPSGPYRLLGYSFGGLVALETARRLEAAGEAVAFLGLIDAVYDRRYWPADLFVAATLQRAGQHLGRMARRPLREAAPDLVSRVARLAARLGARLAPRPARATPDGAAGSLAEHSFAVMAAYRPRPSAIPAIFFGSRPDADFGCDPAELWRDLIVPLTVRRIEASHLALVRDPAALAELALSLDAALAQAEALRRPRVLLVTSVTWLATSRLALALRDAGFAVEAACRPQHSLARLGLLERRHDYPAFAPERALARTVEVVRPDLVVACDDRAGQALYAAYAAADRITPEAGALRARLARSLGPGESHALVYSRPAVIVLAEEAGVRCPVTRRVRSGADVQAWIAANGLPAVLKTDGAWGGRELAFLHDAGSAARAFRKLNAPPGPLRAVKRLLLDAESGTLRAFLARRRPRLSMQGFVAGGAGNIAVACLDGTVLAAVCAEVIESDGAAGPATVVRVIDHPGMRRAAEAVVGRLGLSGFVGLDFILEPDTGAAHLIELNPRATPTAHLIGADGADLAAALAAGLARRRPARRDPPAYAGGIVALFPQELRRDPASPHLGAAHHDVPWHAPELVDAALAEARSSRAALDRLTPPRG